MNVQLCGTESALTIRGHSHAIDRAAIPFRGDIARTAQAGFEKMLPDWNLLTEAEQFALSFKAFGHAARTIAGQADVLAQQIECGVLADRGGADALRLLATLVRAHAEDAAMVGC